MNVTLCHTSKFVRKLINTNHEKTVLTNNDSRNYRLLFSMQFELGDGAKSLNIKITKLFTMHKFFKVTK